MANWSKRKVDPSEINKGQEYTKDDNVSVEELNAIVNNSFNAQGEAERSLNTVKGFQIGTAISGDTAGATINVDSVGEKIILNLVLPKGEKGDKGDKGESGSFGTMDYSELSNKPQINGKELNGNLTTEDLGIETISEKEIDDKLDKKVDKVEGKGLSTNDFTNEEKSKLLGLNNYDDADIKASIKNLQNNKANINDLGELAFKDTLSKSDVGLSNVNNTSDLNKPVSIATQEALNLKANSKDLSAVATSGSYNDLINKPNIPTAISQLTEDATHRTVTDTEKSNWDSKSDFSGNYNDLKNKPTIPNVENFITKDVNNLTNYTLSTGVGTAIDLAVDTTNYKITVSLKNSSGTVLSSDVVDLPLESVVVSGSYDSTSKKVILTLQNGSSIDFSVADLVSGLASQSSLNTTNDNVSKLSTRVGTAETNISNLQSNKVDKVSGKGLSTNDYTTAEKTKLSGIAEGAEVNVQSDWNATSGDSFIKNKPTLGALASKNSLSKGDVGLGNVDNTSDLNKPISTATQNALNQKANSSALNNYVDKLSDQTIEGIKNFKDGVKLGNNQHGVTTGQIEIDGGVLNNPNLNDMTYRGIYHCTKGTNVPSFDYANSQYDLMVFNSSEEGVSLVTQMLNVGWKWWIRRKDSSSWGAWERFGQTVTPNNGKLTIQKNGTQVGTFTANQSGNSTINIEAIDSNDTTYKFAQEEYNKSSNLLDKNKFIVDVNGKIGIDISNLVIGETYTFSSNFPILDFKISDKSNGLLSTGKYDTNGYNTYTFVMSKNSGISSSEKQYLFLGLTETDGQWITSISQLSNYNLQIEKGNIASPYQPYNDNKHITNQQAKFLMSEYDKSKNLFNGNLQVGAWIFADGNYTWTNEYRCSTNYIEVVPNSTITLSVKGNYTVGGSGFVFYNNGSYVGYADHTFTATVPANANQVLFTIFIGSNTFNLTDIQLEYGSTATPYYPYSGELLLWQNGSQSSEMGETTINLSKSLVVGKNYAIYYKYSTGAVSKLKLEFKYGGVGYLGWLNIFDSDANGNYLKSRLIQITSETTIKFYVSMTNNYVSNGQLIPTELYELPN